MFTFSFGSAFAADQTVKYVTGETPKELHTTEAYKDAVGEYGITEAYKYNVTDGLQAILNGTATADTKVLTDAKDADYNILATNYFAPEKAKAKAAVEKAITDVKAATTAKAVGEILTALKTKLDKLVKTEKTIAKYYTDLKANTTNKIDFSRLIARYGADGGNADQSAYDYYLPGYGFIAKADITKTATNVNALNTTYTFVADWFMDNEYRVDIAAGVRAFLSALTPVNQTFKDTFNKEVVALEDEAYAYEEKYDATAAYKNRLTVSDLEGIEALLVKFSDFNDKYYGYPTKDEGPLKVANIGNLQAALDSLEGTYFNQYYAEIAALPAVNKLDDTNKATVIALYDKVDALKTAYKHVWKATTDGKPATADKMDVLTAAYNFYKDADVDALTTAATKFTELKGNDFDKSEKNVAALEAARKLYDENVKNYKAYNSTIEAKILAAEYNKAAAAGYKEKEDKIDTSKVQAYLNNATVKVTTKALGNTKIRVNARIDATSFNYILGEMSDGCTVSYKFYYKKAGAASYKASKVKDRNYITYTKVSLKKGTKYKFQCEVTIKDVDGKVVATKSYKASTVGSRICR